MMQITITYENVEEAQQLVQICQQLLQAKGEIAIEPSAKVQQMKDFIKASYREGVEVEMRQLTELA